MRDIQTHVKIIARRALDWNAGTCTASGCNSLSNWSWVFWARGCFATRVRKAMLVGIEICPTKHSNVAAGTIPGGLFLKGSAT